ncbi:MAG: beta-ketoacyl-[acyl-carrier-protein] synthase II [delta proteobacterium ML8_F1]|nr:MAG: beta-ketoacyl-[acyl-carrier-protein] synthase II [delta proteobacterium ML8_F1]
MTRRVVVTGIGVISPIGNDLASFWKALVEGKNGIERITRFDPEDSLVKIAAEVKGFDPLDYMNKKDIKRMDLFTQYGVATARIALKDSGINPQKVDMTRFGVLFGSGVGGIETFENETRKFLEKGSGRVSPFFIPMMIANIASGQISIATGAKGPNATVVTACASSTHAIGDAFRIVQRGDADLMFAGGSEAAITPLAIAGFSSMKALSTRNDEPSKASRPFDKDRDGFIMGEGSGMLILEEYGHAVKRGAKIYAEIAGYGATGDAYHITSPAPEGGGAMRSMAMAARDAGIVPGQIDYINAHGTSTPLNDLYETMAIKGLLKEDASRVSVSSTKSMTGHLLGAAGSIEAIACIMALIEGTVPPTINLENPSEGLDLDYTPKVAKKRSLTYALSNSLGFGGHNGTLVFKKI